MAVTFPLLIVLMIGCFVVASIPVRVWHRALIFVVLCITAVVTLGGHVLF